MSSYDETGDAVSFFMGPLLLVQRAPFATRNGSAGGGLVTRHACVDWTPAGAILNEGMRGPKSVGQIIQRHPAVHKMSAPLEFDSDEEEMPDRVGIITGGASGTPPAHALELQR